MVREIGSRKYVVCLEGGEIGVGCTEKGIFVARRTYLCTIPSLLSLARLVVRSFPQLKNLQEFEFPLHPKMRRSHGYYFKGSWFMGKFYVHKGKVSAYSICSLFQDVTVWI